MGFRFEIDSCWVGQNAGDTAAKEQFTIITYSFRPKVFAEPRIQAPPLLLPLLIQITTESGKSIRSR